jgi:hypothetical protein
MRLTVVDLKNEALLLVLDDGWFECGYDCLLVNFCNNIMERERTSSKTFLSPRCVNAEHSTYLTAPSSLANLSP